MSPVYFMIFRQGNQARASRLVLPAGVQSVTGFHYEGRAYERSVVELSSGDHFLNLERHLAGFSFLLGGDTDVAQGRLATECENVEVEGGTWLKFFLTAGRSFRNDNCQFVFPEVLGDGLGDHIILINECPTCWTALGFRLAPAPVPQFRRC